MINFEFPIGEKVRNLLRLEDVFQRIEFFLNQEHAHDHHQALMALFEIGEMGSRGDLRTDLLQELERQRQMLQANLENVTDQMAQEVVETALMQCDQVMERLRRQSGRLGYHLRDNEWLLNIHQRGQKGGSLCCFDLPSYHFWLNQTSAVRLEDLSRWLEPLLPVRDSAALLLRILRTRGERREYVAKNGCFHEKSSAGRVIHLLKVSYAADLPAIPELSAGKYAINIRFVDPPDRTSNQLKTVLSRLDIPFVLTCCRL